MRIGALSQATGVDIETIRYYEKQGLLPGPARSDNGYRDYTRVHLERLAFVRHCRALDMSLADIAQLLACTEQAGQGKGSDAAERLIDQQLARVQARLKSMQALEQQLMALRAQCDADHAHHACGILQELVSAAHGEACACHGDESMGQAPST